MVDRRTFRSFRVSGIAIAVLFIGGGFASSVCAQTPGVDPVLTVSDEIVELGTQPVLTIALDNPVGGLAGWSFGVCHGPLAGLTVLDVAMSDAVATVQTGDPPDFHQVEITPDGWTVGAVISSHGGGTLPAGQDDLYTVTYSAPVATGVASVEFCDTIGVPPTSVCLFIPSASATCVPIVEEPGSIEVVTEIPHRRGDCNQDANVDLADAIFLELYLFVGGDVPGCLDACDHNDDGTIDIADSITLLMWLFQGGAPLPAPAGACGVDPTPDEVGCASFSTTICP